MAKQWSIEITGPFTGFAPAYYVNTYPSFGNKNQAGRILDCDVSDYNVLSQGLGLANLTAGTEDGAVTTLIKSILENPVSSGVTYAIGGAKLYQITTGAVTNAGIWPHAIDKGAVTGEDGESVVKYGTNLYYSYNHSGSAGDIGKYDLATTYDDDWASTVPSGAAALASAPHKLLVGGDDILYFTNGRFFGSYDGTTFDAQALDLPVNFVINDAVWHGDILYIAANNPNVANNSNIGEIFTWDTVSASWNTYPHVRINGRIGAMIVKNGYIFVFYEENGSTDAYKLGVIQGNSIQEVTGFSGSLPLYYQVSLYKNFIIWVSGGLVYAWGSRDKDIPAAMFQWFDGGYTTVGGLACPFGAPYVASTQSTSYKIAQTSGYSVLGYWKSLDFNISKDGGRSIVDKAVVHYEATATGARVDVKIDSNRGTETTLGTITHTSDSGRIKKTFTDVGIECETFRVYLDWTNGSATNALKVRSIQILGHKISED